MKVISATGEGALEPAEQETLREAADALFFCEDLAERWEPELAEQVLQDLEESGPPQLVRLGESG